MNHTALLPAPATPDRLGAAILAMAEDLARFTDEPDGLTCAYLTPAHQATAALLRDWMQAAGMRAHIDAVGNVVGTLAGRRHGQADNRTLITGSHYDTVRNGGKYDGRLGIVLLIAIAALLQETGESLDFDLELVGFAEEEGVRFASTFLGSSALVGRFDPALLEARDAAGISMRTAIIEAGHDPAAITRLARDPNTLIGFLEVHIEQGPVLLDRGLPVGIVNAIAGSRRFLVELTGLASHAGTTPMTMRRDAATAAAEMVLAIEQRCSGIPSLVGTVGQLQVPGGSVNTIPGSCRFSIDVRAATDATRDAAVQDIEATLQAIAARRQIGLQITPVMQAAAVPCDPTMIDRLEAAVMRAGVPPLRLLSGAGHDAMMMARAMPMGMLFVRCGHGGISHHPAETMTAADADIAARIFLDVLRHLAAPSS